MSTGAKIPWLRVLVEGVVIVGSILLAFGIDAWWDRSNENSEALEMLTGLRTDFEAHRSVLQGQRDSYQVIQDDLGLLLGPDSLGHLPVERADSIFYRLITVPTLDLGQGMRDAVVLSGRLELIEDPQLRRALADWERWVEEVRDMQLVMRDYAWSQVAPALADRRIPFARAMATRQEQWPAPLPSPSNAMASYRAAIEDPAFQVHLSLMYGTTFWHIEEYDEALAVLEEILTLIESELDDRT